MTIKRNISVVHSKMLDKKKVKKEYKDRFVTISGKGIKVDEPTTYVDQKTYDRIVKRAFDGRTKYFGKWIKRLSKLAYYPLLAYMIGCTVYVTTLIINKI